MDGWRPHANKYPSSRSIAFAGARVGHRHGSALVIWVSFKLCVVNKCGFISSESKHEYEDIPRVHNIRYHVHLVSLCTSACRYLIVVAPSDSHHCIYISMGRVEYNTQPPMGPWDDKVVGRSIPLAPLSNS